MPIELSAFRAHGQGGAAPDTRLRLDRNQQLTTASRGFRGYLVEKLNLSSARREQAQIATELIRRLEESHGKDVARHAVTAVRKDIRVGSHSDELVMGKGGFTVGQVREILRTADELQRKQDQKWISADSAQGILTTLRPNSHNFKALARDLGIDPEALSDSQKATFEQLLFDHLQDVHPRAGGRSFGTPNADEVSQYAKKLLRHIAGRSEGQLQASRAIRSSMRENALGLLRSITGRGDQASQPQEFIARIKEVMSFDNAYLEDLRMGGAEVGADERTTFNRRPLLLAISSLDKAHASSMLHTIRAPGSAYRQVLASALLIQNAPLEARDMAATAARSSILELLVQVDAELARRADEHGSLAGMSYQDTVGFIGDKTIDELDTPGQTGGNALASAGLTSMTSLKAQLTPTLELAQRLTHWTSEAYEIEVANERKEMERLRSEARHKIWSVLISASRSNVTPEQRTTLNALAHEFRADKIDYSYVDKTLKERGIHLGEKRGLVDLTYGQGLFTGVEPISAEIIDRSNIRLS